MPRTPKQARHHTLKERRRVKRRKAEQRAARQLSRTRVWFPPAPQPLDPFLADAAEVDRELLELLELDSGRSKN